MPRFLTRYLLLSSVFVVLSACAYSKFAHPAKSEPIVISSDNLEPLVPMDGSSIKFRASIDVLNRHFSGIIIVKQIDSTVHFVFITELGMKMFDLEVRNRHLEPVYVFEPLNKPGLVALLCKDFEIMLLLDAWQQQAVYVTKATGRDFIKWKTGTQTSILEREGLVAERRLTFRKKRRDTRTTYTTSGLKQISLKQYGLVKLYIDLTEIPKTND